MSQEITKQKALITGINVIAIYVSDLERAKDFYVNTLGMEYREDMSGGKGVILMAAGSMFYVEGGREKQVDAQLTYNTVSPCFASESVRSAYETLKEADVAFVEDYNQSTDTFAMFRIADPDGNVIEFAGKP